MRRTQQQKLLDFVDGLHQAHEEIKEAVRGNKIAIAGKMLSECQEFAVNLGESIEAIEGEGHITVSYIEEYCEVLFHIYDDIGKQQININKTYKILRKKLLKVENSIRNDIDIKTEIVFFPYKASMWDSLESVYLAAKEDAECDVYCVPIPYFDLNSDRSLGQMHYEGNEYPENIEVTDWQEYCLEERNPDVIFIHNPYDNCNFVTSVHPRYYSSNLKKYTNKLVYVPYYITSGGMNEGQRLCPAYINADYIVIQSPLFRNYFDERISDDKFLAFGSPKVDRVIMKCQNPPEPPEEWKNKMAGKKVYFYNTSISGVLANAENFLKKMMYVFQCFEGREDACLLWRPHPLLEATFHSMRPQYWEAFETLRKQYIDQDIGILDTSADIENVIALSDAYIGEAGTSVIALFGVVGKPIFILDNKIHRELLEEEWRERIQIGFNFTEQDRFTITQGNNVYISEPYQYDYHFYCELPDDLYGNYYSLIIEIGNKKYACCSQKSQDILVIGENGIEKRVELEYREGEFPAFSTAWKYNQYLILIPLKYNAIVRYDTITGEVRYFRENIDVFIRQKNSMNIVGGAWIYQGVLYIASPVENMIYELDIKNGKTKIVELPVKTKCGCNCLAEYKKEMWLLPYEGKVIMRWNLLTGEVREYKEFPEGFKCIDPINNREGEELPFQTFVFYGDYMYLTPLWANMYLKLNILTGEFVQWEPPFEEGRGGSRFLWDEVPEKLGPDFKIYSYYNRKLFLINVESNECKEIDIKFDMEELKCHEQGFCGHSEKLRYACVENCFNSIRSFLDGKIVGNSFDIKKQVKIYKEIIANQDGNCGKQVYEFVKSKIDSGK